MTPKALNKLQIAAAGIQVGDLIALTRTSGGFDLPHPTTGVLAVRHVDPTEDTPAQVWLQLDHTDVRMPAAMNSVVLGTFLALDAKVEVWR